MEQPSKFVAYEECGKVCQLKTYLYGLKQSLWAWSKRFSKVLKKFGLKKGDHDHFLFYKLSNFGCILLVVHVNDIIITGNENLGISKLKAFLQTKFQNKDLGVFRYFLSIEITRRMKRNFLSQRKYVLDILNETGLLGAKLDQTPMIPNVTLGLKDG